MCVYKISKNALFVALMVCVMGVFAGCLSSAGGLGDSSSQSSLDENSKEAIKTYTKKPLELTYKKVLNEKELDSLNDCVAESLSDSLSQGEKLFLGGNALEKAANAKEVSNIAKKAKISSPEMKSAIGVCSAKVGLSKAISKIKL